MKDEYQDPTDQELEEEFRDLSDQELEIDRMELEDADRKLRNMRALNPSREDALAGYEAIVDVAYKLVAAGWNQQAASLRAVGRVGSDTVEWRLPTRFTEAQAIIQDHEGAGALLAATNALEFGRDHAEIQAEHNQKREKIGRIRAELARRQAARSTSQASAVYQDELSKIRS